MEDNINYVFQGKVGDTNCKIDKQLWQFEDESTISIPVKAVSNVILTKQFTMWWFIVLSVGALIGLLVYGSANSAYEPDFTPLYIVVAVTIILALLVLFLVRKYMLKVIPHSGISYSVSTWKRGKFQELYNAMQLTLRANL